MSTGDANSTEGIAGTAPGALLAAFAGLVSAENTAESTIMEQAIAMLMLAYDLDADNAAEMLAWGSQARAMGVEALAGRLTECLGRRGDVRPEKGHCGPAHLRLACDEVLFTGHGGPAATGMSTNREP